MCHFPTQLKLTEHQSLCREHEPTCVIIPAPFSVVKFKITPPLLKASVAIVADFECFLEPVSEMQDQYTVKVQPYKLSSFCYFVCWSDGTPTEPVLYRGENPAEVFFTKTKKCWKAHE